MELKAKTGGTPMEPKAMSKRKRRRTVDYPPFCYDDQTEPVRGRRRKPRDQSLQEFVIRFPSQKRVLKTTSTKYTRSVSIPEIEEEKETWLERLLIPIFGPIESSISNTARRTRLLNNRSYARADAFKLENLDRPPNLEDLSSFQKRRLFEGFWVSTPARFLSFSLAYLSFPFIIKVLDTFVTMAPEELDGIASKFGPGVSILYGTFVSLTLSILYNRQRAIQDNVAVETALLTTLIRSLLSVFQSQKDLAVEAGQCVADQIRTLVRGSRGSELMLQIYSDPYARLLELIDESTSTDGSKVAYCRDILKDLVKTRANRLSDEALALPPTHFLILNILTILILVGYAVSILPTLNRIGEPSNESSILFASLVSIYVLFFNFANDVNNPFEGVYQIRRSVAASNMLEAKWLIANHPLLRNEVDFEDADDQESGQVLIRSPGLGDLQFEKDDIFLDKETELSMDS